ncbi:hypothetical protein RUM43_012159 [Polyplax serrata]|uniref:Uncharacterized protein n=1 Tax=Polyplax serrata TaxID=468196 RepID=A0AAN8P6K1_POLSC
MRTKLPFLLLLAFALLVSGRSAKKKEEENKKEKETEKQKEKETSQEVEKEEEEEEDGEADSVDVESEELERVDNEHMTICLKNENVTESEMKNFLISRGKKTVREPLKKAVLCFLKRINFFDGKKWNVDVIGESVGDDTTMFKAIKDCLQKDDKKLTPHERTYRVQKCVLESEDIQ